MAAPTAYTRQYNFQNYQSNAPSTPLPGTQVDIELNAVKTALDQTQSSLAQIQRDDGALKNASVGYDQLKAEVEIGINPPTAWVTSTAYAVRDTVTRGTGFYRCLVSHTSGTFATDLAAEKWELIVDFATDISLGVVADALHSATAKTALVDADEFFTLDSAATYVTKRATFLSVANSLWTKLGALIAGGTGKTTPVDADTIPLSDSAASDATKKLTWANLKATAIAAIGPAIAAATGKTTPVDADSVLLSDSAASDVNKKLTWANLKATVLASPAVVGNLSVTLSDDGAAGPGILTYHNSASPAASDIIGQWFAYGRDSAANYEAYTTIRSMILDATNGSEDGQVDVLVKSAGSWASVIEFRGDYINLPLGQLRFPATQNASADANTLDDYEEGTFTPAFSAVGATFSYATQYGSYTKIGNRVFVTIRLALNTSGNTLAGATLTLTGLPFANGESEAVLAQVNWSNSTTSYIDITAQLASGAQQFTFYGVTAATANKIGGSALNASAALHATNGSVFRISMSYLV